jgi:hypothetical protein
MPGRLVAEPEHQVISKKLPANRLGAFQKKEEATR